MEFLDDDNENENGNEKKGDDGDNEEKQQIDEDDFGDQENDSDEDDFRYDDPESDNEDVVNFGAAQDDSDIEYEDDEDDEDDEDRNIMNNLENQKLTEKPVSAKQSSNNANFMVDQNVNNTFIIDEFVRKEELEMKMEDENEEEHAVVNEPYNFKKFEEYDIESYISDVHPEMLVHNINEIYNLLEIKKTAEGIIVDPLHQTLPFLTKFEKTRIIGQRAKQIEYGVEPLMAIPSNITNCITIAEMELHAKKLPFIIRRPIPNGGFEYWRLEDLEIL